MLRDGVLSCKVSFVAVCICSPLHRSPATGARIAGVYRDEDGARAGRGARPGKRAGEEGLRVVQDGEEMELGVEYEQAQDGDALRVGNLYEETSVSLKPGSFRYRCSASVIYVSCIV